MTMLDFRLIDFVKHGQHNQKDHGHRYSARLVSQTRTEGGATFRVRTQVVPKVGVAVSPYPQASRAMDASKFDAAALRDYVNDHRTLLSKPEHHLGIWHDGESGKVFLDVSIVTSRRKAIALAREHDQIAVWDLGAGKEITVNRAATSGGVVNKAWQVWDWRSNDAER